MADLPVKMLISRKRILCVDDVEDIRELVATVLNKYEVIQACTKAEGLRKARAERFDRRADRIYCRTVLSFSVDKAFLKACCAWDPPIRLKQKTIRVRLKPSCSCCRAAVNFGMASGPIFTSAYAAGGSPMRSSLCLCAQLPLDSSEFTLRTFAWRATFPSPKPKISSSNSI